MDASMINASMMVVRFLASIITTLSIVLILYGSFKYVTSQGEPKETEKSKMMILAAGISLFLTIVAMLIMTIFTSITNGGAPSTIEGNGNGNSNMHNIIVQESRVYKYEKAESENSFYCKVIDSMNKHVYLSELKTETEAEILCNQYPEGMNQEIYFEEIDGNLYIVEK